MPADIDHARIIERLGDAHEQRLQDALKILEERVIGIVSAAPLRQGNLFDLEWAIAARAQIQSVLEQEYLSKVQEIISEYDEAVLSAQAMIGEYGAFVEIDQTVIRNLKRLSFQGFEAIGAEYLDVMANEIYQNTLTGRLVADSIKTLRHTINGVYIESDSAEANKLVDIAKNTTGKEQQDAIEKLHTLYARDRVGNNLRRYASQMVHDSLMQFDSSVVVAAGKESGADKWKYYGSVIRDSRDWCKDHAGKIYTEEEIREMWANNSWSGKAPGDPFIVRGGYNCRHHWRPVFEEEENA
jgi:hypothetical protein